MIYVRQNRAGSVAVPIEKHLFMSKLYYYVIFDKDTT
jgi:hypothetical protein